MNHRLKRLCALLIAGLAFLLAGCDIINGLGEDDAVYESDIAISPVAQQGSGSTQRFTLYFGYRDEDMLAAETRNIEIPLDERWEIQIIKQLIQGPSITSEDLRSLFSERVEVVSVESSSRLLIVTLSSNFLDAPDEAPSDWQESSYWIQQVQTRNRLALYSIVNTVTELGEYDRVQLQIASSDGSGLVQNLKRTDVGLAEPNSGEGGILGPVGRAYDSILSPRRVVDIVIEAWSNKDWERIYSFIAAAEPDGEARPSREEITATLSASTVSFIKHTVLDTTVSLDGQSATIALDLDYLRGEGKTETLQNTIVRLVREGESWKILYSSLEALSTLES